MQATSIRAIFIYNTLYNTVGFSSACGDRARAVPRWDQVAIGQGSPPVRHAQQFQCKRPADST